jgi:hypothetical protein
MDIELIAMTPDAERVIERAARACYESADRMLAELTRRAPRVFGDPAREHSAGPAGNAGDVSL